MHRFRHTTAILILFAMCCYHVPGLAQDKWRNLAYKNIPVSTVSRLHPRANSRETITGRREASNGFTWNYRYDVVLKQSALIVKVGINTIPAQGLNRFDLDRVKPAWEKGIERIWSHRFALETSEGRRYPIIVDVSFKGPRFHHDVIVRPGSGRTDELNWNVLDSLALVSHEFGHMIGMYDEYHKGALAPQGAIIDPASIMTSNPAGDAAPHARHYEPFRSWFVSKTMMSNVRIIHEKGSHE